MCHIVFIKMKILNKTNSRSIAFGSPPLSGPSITPVMINPPIISIVGEWVLFPVVATVGIFVLGLDGLGVLSTT